MEKIINAFKAVRLQAKRVPLWLRLVIIGVTIALPVYWMATFSGPYAWWSEMQAGWFHGSYDGRLSFLLSWLLLLLPALALVLVVGVLFPEVDPKDDKGFRL
jgi:hypothetical protein